MTFDLSDGPTPKWAQAMLWFNDGDPSKVIELILSGEEQTLHTRQFLADVVSGKLKPPRVDKTRRILNWRHKEFLRCKAWDLYGFYGLSPAEKRELKKSIKVIKEDAINTVCVITGATKGTVLQAWKEVVKPMIEQDKRNQAHIDRLIGAEKQKEEQRLKAAKPVRPNPFGHWNER